MEFSALAFEKTGLPLLLYLYFQIHGFGFVSIFVCGENKLPTQYICKIRISQKQGHSSEHNFSVQVYAYYL